MESDNDDSDYLHQGFDRPVGLERRDSERTWNETMDQRAKKQQRQQKEKTFTENEENFFKKFVEIPVQNKQESFKNIFRPNINANGLIMERTPSLIRSFSLNRINSIATPGLQIEQRQESIQDFEKTEKSRPEDVTRQTEILEGQIENKSLYKHDSAINKGLYSNEMSKYKEEKKKMGENENSLSQLRNTLERMFKNEEFSNGMKNLSEMEKRIFEAIIQRKFQKEIKIEIYNQELIQEIRNIITSSNKRPEENYKFIFKKCLKKMKENLKDKKKNKKKLKKREFEKYFYNYYFKEISEKEQIPLEHFFHPKNSQAIKNLKVKNAPKTINTAYIQNISKSKDFVKEFMSYLNQNLLNDYKHQIDSKFEGLIQKWVEEFEKVPSIDTGIRNIQKYILENKKCKLPWTVLEIQEAIGAVIKLFNQISFQYLL